MSDPHVLVIDGYNFIHRSRAGQMTGDYVLIYQFFRSLRALVQKMKPTRIYFVVEGVPVKRLAQFPEYKGNRDKAIIDEVTGDAIFDPELDSFLRQKDILIRMLAAYFPVTLMRHKMHECDDVIANLIARSSASVPWTVVSNDTDFIQLLCSHDHVKVYDPMRGGRYQVKPPCDYVKLKSLTGDGSDNIPGLKGVGPKTAEKMLLDADLMQSKCLNDPEKVALYERNQTLIRFHDWTEDEFGELESSTGQRNWDAVKALFDSWSFGSITADGPWKKFVGTFDSLWAVDDTPLP